MFNVLKETGASAGNTDAQELRNAHNLNICSNGAGGQAQSDRSLVRIIRRHLKSTLTDIRRIQSRYQLVPLNDPYVVDDLQAFADRCHILICDACHHRGLKVQKYRDLALCPRCLTRNWESVRGNGNGYGGLR